MELANKELANKCTISGIFSQNISIKSHRLTVDIILYVRFMNRITVQDVLEQADVLFLLLVVNV